MKSPRIYSSFVVDTSYPVKKVRANNYPLKTARNNILVIPEIELCKLMTRDIEDLKATPKREICKRWVRPCAFRKKKYKRTTRQRFHDLKTDDVTSDFFLFLLPRQRSGEIFH